MDFLNKLPQDLNLERSILSGCLLYKEMCAEAIDTLTDNDFYKTEHISVFCCIVDMVKNDEPVSLETVFMKLKELGLKATPSYLSTIIDEPIPGSMEFYCRKLKRITVRREAITVCWKGVEEFIKDDAPKDAVEQFQRIVLSLDTPNEKKYTAMRDLVTDGEDRHSLLYKQKKNLTGIPTGFGLIDNKTCGLQNGDLIIIAGRPSMGKSAFATNLSMNMAKLGHSVGMFSIEMAEQQIYDRMVASESGIDSTKFRNGRFDKDEWKIRNKTVGELYSLPIFVDDKSKTQAEIMSQARVMKKKEKIECIIVDYLQLINGDRNLKKNYEIGEITKEFKHLAKELNIPIILLAQLNRMLETRDKKWPRLSDLKDSGSIEQDADVVMFIYRHEVYVKKHEDDDTTLTELYKKWQGKAEVNIAKQRMGPIGRVPLTWLAETTTFKNYRQEENIV